MHRFRLFAALAPLLVGANAWCASISARVTDQRGAPVADAVLIASPQDGDPTPPPRPHRAIIDQVDKEFVPHVSVVAAPTLVTFPNRDNVRHQVYSFSAPKRFELPLYAGTPAAPILFDKPGVVVLGCNIHDWMVGYVYVSESPYFSKTGTDGRTSINVPDGRYVLRVWHAQMADSEASTGQTAVLKGSTELSWSVTLRPELRVRRSPADEDGFSY